MNKFKNELDSLHQMLEERKDDLDESQNSAIDSDLNILLTDD